MHKNGLFLNAEDFCGHVNDQRHIFPYVHDLTVFGHLTLVLKALIEEQQRDILNPHHLHGSLQLGQGGDAVVPLQLSLHNGPDILNGIQIQLMPRPVHHKEVLLPQQSH